MTKLFAKQFAYTLILSIISSTAFAKGPGRHRGERGPKMEKMLESLDLNAEQKTKIFELNKSSKDEIKTLKAANREARKSFEDATKDATKNDEELRKLHDLFVESKSKMMKARFEKMLKIRSVLTEEQRKKFSDFPKGPRHERDED